MRRLFIQAGMIALISFVCSQALANSSGSEKGRGEYEVGPNALANQFLELAPIPEFKLSKEKVEQITGVHMHDVIVQQPTQDMAIPGQERLSFGPTPKRPYNFSWQKGAGLTQYYFVWNEYEKQYLPFERAPAGMCIAAKDLGDQLIRLGWKLHSTTRLNDLPPSNTYARGDHGRLRLVFDESNDCVIQFILVATLSEWQ